MTAILRHADSAYPNPPSIERVTCPNLIARANVLQVPQLSLRTAVMPNVLLGNVEAFERHREPVVDQVRQARVDLVELVDEYRIQGIALVGFVQVCITPVVGETCLESVVLVDGDEVGGI